MGWLVGVLIEGIYTGFVLKNRVERSDSFWRLKASITFRRQTPDAKFIINSKFGLDFIILKMESYYKRLVGRPHLRENIL